jgi:type VI secretion system protein ImpA
VASLKGRVCVRDILVAKNLLPAGGAPRMSVEELQALLREAAAKGPLPLEVTQTAVQALDTIRSCLAAKVNSADIPNLQVLTGALIAVIDTLGAALGVEAVQADGAAGTSDGAPVAIGGSDTIRGRDDAVRQLERICEFIQRTEPGNPAPLLIRRAQRLMSKDFLGIIKDLAPGSLDEIQKIAGIE